MMKELYKQIISRQPKTELVPSNEVISSWARSLICLLYPELSSKTYSSEDEIKQEFSKLENELTNILNATKACCDCNNDLVAKEFFDLVPEMYRILNTDIYSILNGDPAATNEFEVIRAYPGFYAISFYRIANALLKLDVQLIPRILTEFAHSRTGIDIHPAAVIGEHFFIDHGTGIVIGETTVIGNNVKLYQGVTLGALSIDKSMAFTKRHPTIGDNVVIYSGAKILGGETVIGHDAIIGGNVWITKSVSPGSRVYHNSEITIIEGNLQNV
ncbi:MAG: serine acetyltransferase [Ginsengibacter sp.]